MSVDKSTSPDPPRMPRAPKPRTPSALQAFVDEIWAAAPRTSRARSGKPPITKALTAAINAGHDAATVVAGMQAYLSGDDCTRDGGKFAKGVHLALAEGRWQAFVAGVEPIQDPATYTDDDWRQRLNIWKHGKWDDDWGAPPGQPSCRVPSKLLLTAAA